MTTVSLELCMVFVSSGCIPFYVREKDVFMLGYICAFVCMYMYVYVCI